MRPPKLSVVGEGFPIHNYLLLVWAGDVDFIDIFRLTSVAQSVEACCAISLNDR